MTLKTNRLLALFSVTLALALELLGVATLPVQGQVQPDAVRGQTLARRSGRRVTFTPRGRGEPDVTAGGASRDGGKCAQDAIASSPSMTPLMPTMSQGVTVAERPTFFVYVPQTSAQQAFFSLKDQNEDYYYQATLPLPGTPGIVSFQLPNDAPALQLGKTYQWSFVTVCGEKLAVDDPRVEGRIERVALDSARLTPSENLSMLERAALYGADGIWYDTLATLAQLRGARPDDLTLTTTWEDLLTSVGLEAIATQPLLQ